MDIKVRGATPDDLADLQRLDTFLQVDSRRAEWIEAWVKSGQTYLALAHGEIAGYAVLTENFFHEGFIEMVMVGKSFRRHGIGTILVAHLAGICRTQRLWCSTNQSNLTMQSLLKAQGFLRAGTVEGLDEGDPELIWCKRLR
jgi:ribosomal protein S18 acetylase RimI-like enzyme